MKLILTYTGLYLLLAISPYNLWAEESDQYPSSEPVKIKVWPRKETSVERFRRYVIGNKPVYRDLCKEVNGG